MNARSPLLIIAAGGTGGHMFPAQALAEVMLRRGWRVRLSTDARGARYVGGFPHSVEIEQVASATFARGTLFNKLLAPLHILGGVLGAVLRMRRDRPDAVVGFGGYPTIPALAAAWLLRRPRMVHEQNGVLGRVNRAFARRVDVVACGTWPTELPAGVEGVQTGNPVRAAVLERAGAPYMPPGDWPMNLLVFGGSQGARQLSLLVPAAVAALAPAHRARLAITQQCRPEDLEEVRAAYAQIDQRAELASYFNDMGALLEKTHLAITRAGASTIAELSAAGRPAILIPYPYATDDHQRANAEALADAGGAWVSIEAETTAESLAEILTRLIDEPQALADAAAKVHEFGIADGAERLADLVEQSAGLKTSADAARAVAP